MPRNILGTLGLKRVFICNIFGPWKMAFPMSLWKDAKGHWKGPKKFVLGTTRDTIKDAKPGGVGGVPTPYRMSRDVGGVERLNVFNNGN